VVNNIIKIDLIIERELLIEF